MSDSGPFGLVRIVASLRHAFFEVSGKVWMDTEVASKKVPAIRGMGEVTDAKSQPIVRTREGAAEDVRTRIVAMVKEPQFQMLTISTGAGAITVGAAGGAFGIATGIVAGSVAGVAPALATFGLSIPAGAMLGAAAGLLVGTTAGGVAGGTGGFCLYKYRVQIKDGVVRVQLKARKSLSEGCETARKSLSDGCETVKGVTSRAKLAIDSARTKAHEKAGEAMTFATSSRAGFTSASTMVGGSLGTVAGAACGAACGAAVGLVPAVFTLGLSIPISAGIGLAAGATTGGGAGALGGGACGFVGFTYREEIKRSAGYLRTKTMDSAAQVTERVTSLVGRGSGKTA